MGEFCNCEDASSFINSGKNLITYHPSYGWVVHWVELTEEKGYTQAHKYGLSIRFCPLCGKKLLK